MKSFFLVLLLCTVGSYVFAQWNPNNQTTGSIYYNGGNVGIGDTEPPAKLSIKGDYSLSLEPLNGGPVFFYITTNSANNIIGVNARTKYGLWDIPDSSKPSSFIDFPTYSTNNPYYGGIAFFTRGGGDPGIGTEKMVVLNNGNVGVGVTSPTSEFQVNSGSAKISLGKVPNQYSQALGWAKNYIGLNLARNSQGWIAHSDGVHNGASMILGDPFGQLRIVNVPSSGSSDQVLTESQINGNTRFLINSAGNIGIGLGVSPRSPLEVGITGDNVSVQTALILQQINPGTPNNKAGVSLDFGIGNNSGNNNIEGRISLKETYFGSQPKMFFSLWDKNNVFQDRMSIDTDGNVGIGTTNPDAKLAVKGTVHAEEVKVDLQVPGPDYVFEPTYQLPSLSEIENYIKANKHLPEVPSAKEMEANGINLSEMNMLLLKKVEELTLHLIDQQKQLHAQQELIEKLLKR